MTTETDQNLKLSNNNLQVFKLMNYSDKKMRIITKHNNPWFAATDVCAILGLTNASKTIQTLDEDEKSTITISYSGRKKTNISFISESGLYALIFKSRKSEAKLFRKWVTSEVLPSIRKTGQYKLETTFQQKINSLQKTVEHITDENHTLRLTYKHLEKLHDDIRMKRSYHKFKKGNCIYIVTDKWREKNYLKIGITDNINARLRTYRTSMPDCKINYLLYLTPHRLLEHCLKLKFQQNLVQKNHEYLIDTDQDSIIRAIKSLAKYLNIEATEDTSLSLYNEPYQTHRLVFLDKDGNVEDNVDPINIESEDEKQEEPTEEEPTEEEPTEDTDDIENITEDTEDATEDIIIEKKKSTTYDCDLCDKKYKLRGNLFNHRKKIHGVESEIDKVDDKTCPECKKVFANKGKRNRHINTVHKKLNRVKCPKCKKEFSSRDAVKEHINHIHKGLGKSECKECGKICTNPGNLRRHMEIIHTKKKTTIPCPQCKKQISKYNLKTHINQVHKKKYESQCGICKKILTTSANMKYHMYTSHKL